MTGRSPSLSNFLLLWSSSGYSLIHRLTRAFFRFSSSIHAGFLLFNFNHRKSAGDKKIFSSNWLHHTSLIYYNLNSDDISNKFKLIIFKTTLILLTSSASHIPSRCNTSITIFFGVGSDEICCSQYVTLSIISSTTIQMPAESRKGIKRVCCFSSKLIWLFERRRLKELGKLIGLKDYEEKMIDWKDD